MRQKSAQSRSTRRLAVRHNANPYEQAAVSSEARAARGEAGMGTVVNSANAVAFFDIDGTITWNPTLSNEAAQKGEKGNASAPAPAGCGAGGQGAADAADDETASLYEGCIPSPAVFEAFRRMREAGHATFICTGRPIGFVRQQFWDLGPTGIVASAGAYVRIGNEVIRHEHVPYDLAVETARRLFEAGIDADMETDYVCLSLYPSGSAPVHDGHELMRTPEEFAARVRDLGMVKFCARNVSPDRLERVLPFCREHYTVCDLQGGVLEFSRRGVDKAAGIACALDALGHGRQNTYAFGDSENDLSMADAVETFVAMGNALPNVKERATYITDSVQDDGVATGLAHFGLIEPVR